jgi:hypothetical protein
LGCRFFGGEFFAGICGNLEIILGLVDEEQATATARAIDQSLRQSGGRFAAGFRRGAEAPLYLRSNGKSDDNGRDRSRSLRDDKQEGQATAAAAATAAATATATATMAMRSDAGSVFVFDGAAVGARDGDGYGLAGH